MYSKTYFVEQAVEFAEVLGSEARSVIDYIEEPLLDATLLPAFCKFRAAGVLQCVALQNAGRRLCCVADCRKESVVDYIEEPLLDATLLPAFCKSPAVLLCLVLQFVAMRRTAPECQPPSLHSRSLVRAHPLPLVLSLSCAPRSLASARASPLLSPNSLPLPLSFLCSLLSFSFSLSLSVSIK